MCGEYVHSNFHDHTFSKFTPRSTICPPVHYKTMPSPVHVRIVPFPIQSKIMISPIHSNLPKCFLSPLRSMPLSNTCKNMLFYCSSQEESVGQQTHRLQVMIARWVRHASLTYRHPCGTHVALGSEFRKTKSETMRENGGFKRLLSFEIRHSREMIFCGGDILKYNLSLCCIIRHCGTTVVR